MYLTKRFFLLLLVVILLLGLGYAFAPLFLWGKVVLALLALATLADSLLLYATRGVEARRTCADRFSNGDANEVNIDLENHYPFAISLTVIDETPPIFQRRDVTFPAHLPAMAASTLTYTPTPTRRGRYHFGHLRCFARTIDRKSTRLNSSHANISYAVFC